MGLCPIARPTLLSLKVGPFIRTFCQACQLTYHILFLSRLLCASLTEDRYGAVQRDIPRIFEALFVFLTALEDAQREIVISDDAEEAARAIDVYGRSVDGMFS